MNVKKSFISHQKSKSINNNLALKDFDFNNNLITHQGKHNNNAINNNTKNKNGMENKGNDKENKNTNTAGEKSDEFNFGKTIEEMNQNILDLYYDKSSSFKKKIDELNLKFYLETEKYLNNNKINDYARNQKLQANLFIILFKQINIFIEEIERLNKIILDNKYKKEKILERTNELNEKKHNILIKDNLIQSLKKSNTNTEKKLLETLLHEDKLIKDNERLRKENETYKSLTIVFENELKNTMKKSGLTPQKNKVARHMKTYSDYGVPTTSIINELCGHNVPSAEEKYETINNESKFTERNKKNTSYNTKNGSKFMYSNNKNNYSVNIDKKNKKNQTNRCAKSNNISKNPTLTEQNSIRDKKSFHKLSPNNIQKSKKSQDNKIKSKKDMRNFNRVEKKNIIHKNKSKNNSNNNLCYNFSYNKNMMNSYNNKKLNIIKKNNKPINLDTISNNINSTINTNTNTITETNNLSFEKSKDKNFKKVENKKGYYHKKQKTMSEISFKEIVRVQILNDELSNTMNNNTGAKNNKTKVKKNDAKNSTRNNYKSNLKKIHKY